MSFSRERLLRLRAKQGKRIRHNIKYGPPEQRDLWLQQEAKLQEIIEREAKSLEEPPLN